MCGVGLELDDPLFRKGWTKHWGAHTWFNYDPEHPCQSEVHNCLGTHTIDGN